jgi:hypothetical protein
MAEGKWHTITDFGGDFRGDDARICSKLKSINQGKRVYARRVSE